MQLLPPPTAPTAAPLHLGMRTVLPWAGGGCRPDWGTSSWIKPSPDATPRPFVLLWPCCTGAQVNTCWTPSTAQAGCGSGGDAWAWHSWHSAEGQVAEAKSQWSKGRSNAPSRAPDTSSSTHSQAPAVEGLPGKAEMQSGLYWAPAPAPAIPPLTSTLGPGGQAKPQPPQWAGLPDPAGGEISAATRSTMASEGAS